MQYVNAIQVSPQVPKKENEESLECIGDGYKKSDNLYMSLSLGVTVFSGVVSRRR